MDRLSANGIEETIRKNSYQIEIGGISPTTLMAELTQNDIFVNDWARDMMRSPAFSTLDRRIKILVARATPRDLGFVQRPTRDQFFNRAQQFDLERLPAEAGPHARLQDTSQRPGDWYYIAMNPIADRDGDPIVFTLGRDGGDLWLDSGWADPGNRWRLDDSFLFGVRK